MEPRVGGIITAIDTMIPGGIANLFNIGLGIGAILAFGTLIYAGILYSIAGDNASKQKEAKAWIIAAVKGLALLAFGVVLINIVNPGLREIEEIEINEVPFIEVNVQPIAEYVPPTEEFILTGQVVRHPVPLLRQAEEPWGSMPYGNCKREDSRGLVTYATAGCVPASVAMAVRYFTGNRHINPQTIGNQMVARGYRICGSGTSHSAMNSIPQKHGLTSTGITGWNRTVSCLREGGIVISRMRAVTEQEEIDLRGTPRDRTPIFTTFGHFIVITGADESKNRVYINDPGGINVQSSDIGHFLKYETSSWCMKQVVGV